MNIIRQLFFRLWRPGLLLLSLTGIAYLLYFHTLAHLLPGYSSQELASYASAADWHTILHNPIDAPYKLVLWLTILSGHHSALQTRSVAACFGVIAALLFYMVAYKWYGFRTAFLTTILFATSAGLLHTARLGAPHILQMAPLLFISLVLGYRYFTRYHTLYCYLFMILLGVLLYIPGMVWFELVGIFIARKTIGLWLRQTSTIHISLAVALLVASLVPLGFSVMHNVHLLQLLSGLPTNLRDLTRWPGNFLQAILSIGVRSGGSPSFFVGHAPLLTITELMIALFGGVYCLRYQRTARSTFIFSILLLSLILQALGGSIGTASMLPMVYLLVAAGLKALLGQWLNVFPRNPFARYMGVGLVSIMLFFSVLYQVRSYFVAWPHNAATRRTFSHHQS